MITRHRQALFSSDWHFGHERIAEIRGFSSVEEHDTAILNHLVEACLRAETRKPDSGADIFFAGDFTRGGAEAENRAKHMLLSSLPSSTRLYAVGGNHDTWWDGHPNAFKAQAAMKNLFDSFHDFMRFRIDGHTVWLSHFPYGDRDHTFNGRFLETRLHDTGHFLLHGHTHQSDPFHQEDGAPTKSRQINIGVDAWNLKPVHYEQVRTAMQLIIDQEENLRVQRVSQATISVDVVNVFNPPEPPPAGVLAEHHRAIESRRIQRGV